MPATSSLTVIALHGLAGNPLPQLDALQNFLVPYIPQITYFWWFAWFIMLFVVIRYVYVHGERRGDPHDRQLYDD